MGADMDEDLKAIYSVIVYWWGFMKDRYPKGMNDKDVESWLETTEAKSKEIESDDEGLAWLFRQIGIKCVFFITQKQKERKGETVDWK